MSQRLEAAVKAWDHHWGDRYGDEALEEMGEEVQVALDAADTVMFSEQAVERAARELWILNGLKGDDWIYYPPEDERKVYFTRLARTVIDSLKAA
jgi:hypothetical protein